MAGRTLEEYFVSLGIKGQNVVLNNIKNVKKAADALSKSKPAVNLKSLAGIFGGVSKSSMSPSQPKIIEQQDKKREENNKKFSESINRFNNEGVKRFAGAAKDIGIAASSLDPVHTMQGMTTAMSKIAGGWEILGFSAGKTIEGLGELMNAGVSMASGAVNSAKNSAAAQWALSQRDVTTAYYGGQGIKQSDNKGNLIMSREEHSQLAMTIAGSFGKIQKPFQDTINKLVEGKNTAALAQVASGNWASTGTDKGWILQQISNQTAGLPPSIAQAIQNSLLKNNSDLIQNKKEGGIEEKGQRANARWKNADEDLQSKIFDASQKNLTNLIALNKSFNDITVNLVKSGASLAACVNTMASAVNGAISKIHSGAHK